MKKPYRRFNVFAHTFYGPKFVSETSAKSKEQAVNNVRYKYYGNNSQIYNSDFFAKEVYSDTTSFKWYVIEYCVMDGNNPYFYQPFALYDVRCSPSMDEAKEDLFEEKYFYGDGNESNYREAHFGEIREFETKEEAIIYARTCREKLDKENKILKEENHAET